MGKTVFVDLTHPFSAEIPRWPYFDKPVIDRYIEAVHKVAANVSSLKDYKGKSGWAFWS